MIVSVDTKSFRQDSTSFYDKHPDKMNIAGMTLSMVKDTYSNQTQRQKLKASPLRAGIR